MCGKTSRPYLTRFLGARSHTCISSSHTSISTPEEGLRSSADG